MMSQKELSNLLLHYGRKTSDISFSEVVGEERIYSRIRTYVYNGRHFYHMMCNGELNECFELK